VQFGVGLPFHGYVRLRVNDTPDGEELGRVIGIDGEHPDRGVRAAAQEAPVRLPKDFGSAPVGSFEWEGTKSLNGMPGSQVSVSQFDSDAAWTP
jgi:hypothetical protein